MFAETWTEVDVQKIQGLRRPPPPSPALWSVTYRDTLSRSFKASPAQVNFLVDYNWASDSRLYLLSSLASHLREYDILANRHLPTPGAFPDYLGPGILSDHQQGRYHHNFPHFLKPATSSPYIAFWRINNGSLVLCSISGETRCQGSIVA